MKLSLPLLVSGHTDLMALTQALKSENCSRVALRTKVNANVWCREAEWWAWLGDGGEGWEEVEV